MALIKCKECGKEVSEKAEKCPHCGVVVCQPKKKTGCLTQIFAVIVFGFIAMLIYGACSGADTTTPSQAKRNVDEISSVIPDVYINQPLQIGPFTIVVKQVKETKNIGKYKPSNMYLQVFVEITNNSNTDANAPHFSLHNQTNKSLSPCIPDSHFITDDVKGSVFNAELTKAGETKKGYIPFDCSDYLRVKNAPERNSKPSDFQMLLNDKLNSHQVGHIWLKEATKQ